MRIILASASPRRKELLGQIGIDFDIIKSDVEEKITKLLPADIVNELSSQKALDVADKLMNTGDEEILIIGADTVVSVDDVILGKPKDKADAARMIEMISGRIHQVYTGVALVRLQGNCVELLANFAEKTDVWIEAMSKEEIEAYINTNEPYDKAGAYGIQGIFGRHVKGISGDYNNVVGLPVARLYKELKSLGLQ